MQLLTAQFAWLAYFKVPSYQYQCNVQNLYILLDVFELILSICVRTVTVVVREIYLDEPCPWLTPTEENDLFQCQDGSYCNGVTDSDQWSCCNSHGGRARCPANFPAMCAKPFCAAGGSDYCCYASDVCVELYLGLRVCENSGSL